MPLAGVGRRPAPARRRSRRRPARPVAASRRAASSAGRCPRPGRASRRCRPAARPAGRAGRAWPRSSRAAAPRPAGGRCPARRSRSSAHGRGGERCLPSRTDAGSAMNAEQPRGQQVQGLQHRRPTALCPCRAPASGRTRAATARPACTMSIAALQQTARASESVKSPIDSVSVASDRGSNRIERVAEVVVVEQDQVGLRPRRPAPAPRCAGRPRRPPPGGCGPARRRPGCRGRSRCGAAAASGARPGPPAARRTR